MRPSIDTKVFTELRKELRCRLDAPVLFFWENALHRRLQGEGTTRDVSVLGVFIATPTCPPIQTPVQSGTDSPVSHGYENRHPNPR